MRFRRSSDPSWQSVRDPGDTTTGVLFDEVPGAPPLFAGRHAWHGGRHTRPTPVWLIILVMVTAPALAIAAAVAVVHIIRS